MVLILLICMLVISMPAIMPWSGIVTTMDRGFSSSPIYKSGLAGFRRRW